MTVKNKMCAILNLAEDDKNLRPLTDNRPIAALPFGGRYRLIDVALSNISHAGIDSVALFIGRSGRSIYDHIRSGEPWHLNSALSGGIFTFSQQNTKRMAYMNGVIEDEAEAEEFYYNVRIFLERSKAEYVYVAGSNILSNINILALQQFHQHQDADITVTYKSINYDDSIDFNKAVVIELGEDGYVSDYKDVDNLSVGELINCGLGMYFITVDKMLELVDRAEADGLYLEADAIIEHYIKEYKVSAYEHTGFTSRINSIKEYYDLNMSLLDHNNYQSLFSTSLPILTKTKHGSPTYYADTSDVKGAIVATDSDIYGKVHNSLIHRKVKVEKDAEVHDSIIIQGTKIGEGAYVKHAILDKGTIVKPGARVVGTKDEPFVAGKNSVIEP